ncbi:ABC transporter permease [Clostridium thermarum]|uniref:ABC transporter permease n=1 Tax=Clostridium thermarum TaxID=1716543 RepID=UPI00111D6596|nr:ABC transporter permease subunit [Clostridium thermarum]
MLNDETKTVAAVQSPYKKKKKAFLKELKQNKTLYLMILPAICFFIVFSYLPMVGIYYAFTKYNFKGGLFGSPFIGLKNFEFLFKGGKDAIIWTLTKNTVLYNIAFILVGNILQITTAIVLSELLGKLYKRFAQSVMLLPHFISMVLVGFFAYNLLNYEYGSINGLLKSLGREPINFYGESGYWKYILVFFNSWKGLGYGTVVYLAAVMGIDREMYEAADIDGCNVFQKIRYLTLPSLKPTFIMLLLFSLGGIMRGQFDLFFQLVGNNGALFNATDIIDTYVYRSLAVTFDVGMGTASGLYQSVFGLIIILTVNFIIKKVNEDYALF